MSKNSHFNLNFWINIENILYIHKNLEFFKNTMKKSLFRFPTFGYR
jgi:hypothetical protein